MEVNLLYLGSKNHSAMFEEEREIAGEVEASGEPRALGDIKLGPTLGGKTTEMPYGAAESLCIRRLAVTDSAEFGYRHDDPFRGRVVEEEPGAGNRVMLTGRRGGGDEEREEGIGGDLVRENG